MNNFIDTVKLDPNYFKGKRVIIFGLGTFGNGVAAVKFFTNRGAIITVTDMKPASELKESLDLIKDVPNIKYVFERHDEKDFKSADFIFRSPAIRKNNPLLKIAKDNGAKILMAEAMCLAFSKASNIIGITGTKGKTTTANLITHMIKSSGKKVYLAGVPYSSAISLIDKAEKDDWIVLEISSWDCEGLDELHVSPRLSVITEIDQDHLNTYSSYEEYALSKSSIFKYQNKDGIFVTHADNSFLQDYLKFGVGKKYLVENFNDIWTVREARIGSSASIAKFNNDIFSASKLTGEHNKRNIALTLAVCTLAGLNYESLVSSVLTFKAVPGRLETIGTIGEVEFVNDTTATAPVAAISALRTLKDKNPVVILGGADKNLDYANLVNEVLHLGVEYVLLKGSASDKLISLGLNPKVMYENFPLAVKAAFEKAKKVNGIVLLSPGAASFGMFKNEFDRGEKFVEEFKKLKDENETENRKFRNKN